MKTEIIILSLIGLFLVWRFCLWLFKVDKPVNPPVCRSAKLPAGGGWKPTHYPPAFYDKPENKPTPFHAASVAESKEPQKIRVGIDGRIITAKPTHHVKKKH
jgi:hypothetical protein